MNKKLYNYIITGDTDKFYNSRHWRKKRKKIISRDNKECQLCKEKGYVTVGTDDSPLQVHHIKTLRSRPDLALTDSNLITVCGSCHNELHPEKSKPSKPKYVGVERWE